MERDFFFILKFKISDFLVIELARLPDEDYALSPLLCCVYNPSAGQTMWSAT